MNFNYTAMLLVSYIQQYFNTSIHNSDKSGLKVTDCTVQSAEYGALMVFPLWNSEFIVVFRKWTLEEKKSPGIWKQSTFQDATYNKEAIS